MVAGYGHIHAGDGTRKSLGAHRASWMLAHGPIPPGLMVLHRCDNPPCVNPDHLFLGTAKDNVGDMDTKGRRRTGEPPDQRGELNRFAKLTTEQALEVRELWRFGAQTRAVAERFCLTQDRVRSIGAGKSWSHLGAY